MTTPDDELAEIMARYSPRSGFAKQFRKLKLERLIVTNVLMNGSDVRNLGSAEIAKELGVTPRTVRTYLRERNESLGVQMRIKLQTLDETGKEISEDLLSIDQAAEKLGISRRELRRRIWPERCDRIARARADWEKRGVREAAEKRVS